MKHAKIGAFALLALLVAVPAVMAQGFPKPGPMAMQSKIVIPLYVNGTYAETISFASKLSVNMGIPFTTPDGIRQTDFVATGWHAEGYSQVLGKKITFRLSQGVRQPTSTATALSSGSDFPAVLTFRATYDAEIQGLTTLRGLGGRASGTVNSIPPGGAGLQVQKSIRFTDGINTYDLQEGECATPNDPCHDAVAVAETAPPSS